MTEDPIPELHQFFASGKKIAGEGRLRTELDASEEKVAKMRAAKAKDWIAYYLSVTELAEKLAPPAPSTAEVTSKTIDGSTRSLVGGYLRQVLDTPRAVTDVWGGRIDRQRDQEIMAPAKKEVGKLELHVEQDGGEILVELQTEQQNRWERWLTGATTQWHNQVSAGVEQTFDAKVEEALEPVQLRIKTPLPEMRTPKFGGMGSTSFGLSNCKQKITLPTKAELFFKSARTSLFTVLALASILVPAIVLMLDKGQAPSRGLLVLFLALPVLIFAYKTAAKKSDKLKADKSEELQRKLKDMILAESKAHVDGIHRTLKNRLTQFVGDANKNSKRWLTETEYELDQITDKSGGQSASSRPSSAALNMEARILPAIVDRISALRKG